MFFTAILVPAAAFVLSTTACDRDAAPADRAVEKSPATETIPPGAAGGAITYTRDPDNGSLQLAAQAPYEGSWDFKDVTSSFSERAMGGTTETTLTIESHQVPPGVHLSFRLTHPGGEIDAGTYSIDGQNDGRTLDARWEYNTQHFRSLSPAKGNVTISSITEDRVAGTYEVTLVPMAEGQQPAVLQGTFDTKIQR